MKTIRFFMLAMTAIIATVTVRAQSVEAEVPGDHFSLEGALELFKRSASPEEFEKLLNSPDEKVNNLDLNGDGYIDYVRVIDREERNVHVFILQAVVSENQVQDVAVIELEKKGNGEAVLQIVGDSDVYGIETIIEPTREVRTYAGTQTTRTVVNVWTWPVVRYVYHPTYTVWVSPWGWSSRPVWWHRWRPVTYVHYHSIWRPYRPYYAVCHTRRVHYAHTIYRPHRRTSVIVHNRYRPQTERYRTVYRDNPRHDGRNRDDRRFVENKRPTRDARPADRTATTTTPSRQYTVDRNALRNRMQTTPRSNQTAPDRSTYERRESPTVTTGRAQEVRPQAPARMERVETPERNRPTLNTQRPPVNRSAPQLNRTPPRNSPSTQPRRSAPTMQRSAPTSQPTMRSNTPSRRAPADLQRSRSTQRSQRAGELRMR